MQKTYQCTVCGTEKSFHHSKSNTYCSVKCQGVDTRKKRIHEWLVEGKDWTLSIPAWVKDKDGYLASTRGYACEECGIDKWNGIEVILECDHIDGNHKNNRPENLRLLCPNCHSQTDTYKNRNIGKGRKRKLP